MERDLLYMTRAMEEARVAGEAGEVPVGAVLAAYDGTLLAAAGNRTIRDCDPSAHAEMVVLRRAALAVGNHRLPGTTIYVTLEPCPMCAGAMLQARVSRLVFGATDPKAGAVLSLYRLGEDSRLNHSFVVEGGVLAREAAQLLRAFFRARR